jgi:hypothetical protein
MLTVNFIDLQSLRNAEFIQFSNDGLDIIHKYDENVLKVSKPYLPFQAKMREITALFKKDQGSNITPKIEKADVRRDDAYMGISKNIESYLTHFDENVKAASQLLWDRLKVFGIATDVVTAALPAETAILNSVVTEFTTVNEYKDAVAMLNLTAWIAELKTANDDLAKLYKQRTEELGEANPNKIKDLRLAANQLYYNLREMLQSQATVAEFASPYDKCINELNAHIEQYNQILIKREASAKDKKRETGEDKK